MARTGNRRLAVLLIFVAAVFCSAPVLAHEGHVHYVMGTIKAIEPSRIVVTEADEKNKTQKTVEIALTEATKFRRGRIAADRATFKPGERVVVAVGNGKAPLKADEVRAGAASEEQ